MSVHAIRNLHQSIPTQSTFAQKTAGKPVSTGPVSTTLGGVTSGSSTASATTSTAQASSTGFDALFSSYVSTPAATPTTAASPASTLFSATYEQNATVAGPDGSKTTLNPNELATASTATQVAQLLGGNVVTDSMGSNFASSAPTREIAIPGSNVEINAGLAANLFATYGTGAGSQAWVQLNQDLGLNPGSLGPVS